MEYQLKLIACKIINLHKELHGINNIDIDSVKKDIILHCIENNIEFDEKIIDKILSE